MRWVRAANRRSSSNSGSRSSRIRGKNGSNTHTESCMYSLVFQHVAVAGAVAGAVAAAIAAATVLPNRSCRRYFYFNRRATGADTAAVVSKAFLPKGSISVAQRLPPVALVSVDQFCLPFVGFAPPRVYSSGLQHLSIERRNHENAEGLNIFPGPNQEQSMVCCEK